MSVDSSESRHLPQELIDAIVDSVADPRQDGGIHEETLRACSLAGRAFVRPCQQRLFSSLKLYTAHNSFCARGTEASVIQTSLQLAQVLRDSPHLAPYVRQVSVAYPKSISVLYEPEYLQALADVFQHLSGLETLALQPRPINGHEIRTSSPIPQDLVAPVLLSPSCENLRRLELTRIRLTNIAEIEDILGVANQLKELVLRDIRIYEDDERVSSRETTRYRRPPPLEYLELRVVPSYFYQEALEAFVDRSRITNLRSICIDEYDDLILRSNASTLEEICMIRQHGQDVHLVGTGLLDALSGPVLRSLHLKLTRDLTNLPTNIQHIRNLTNTRAAFGANKSIFINLQDESLLSQLLSDIDDLFGGAHIHPGPKRVVMQLAFRGRIQEVRGWMPSLDARGVLEVMELTDARFAAETRQYRCTECYEFEA
ncbi:hypothetical protein HMN09_00252600 [Mycena chlorophos]|uniref:Uncharacterized protein n=1 Tax=Mycena chlorophos TaxID=658473 RepID=A0A8H6TKY5_MYCCL|nr:hypothetical protein HMN09_00252600 [Mycena chlorophos]